jgi:hypothetical protein
MIIILLIIIAVLLLLLVLANRDAREKLGNLVEMLLGGLGCLLILLIYAGLLIVGLIILIAILRVFSGS